MKVNKKEAELLQKAIKYWTKEEIINDQQAEKLNKSYEQIAFDWQALSLYAFVFAVASILISAIALLADKWLMEMLERIVDASEGIKATFFSISSILLFYYGQKFRRSNPDKPYSHTAINLLAIGTCAVALGYFSIIFGKGSGHFSIFIFIAVFIYGILGVYFKSNLIWTSAMVSLFLWFGFESAYQSNWNEYFLGMSFLVRFIPFTVLVLIGCLALRSRPSLKPFFRPSYLFCLTFLLIIFWLVSIFGNYGSFATWSAVTQVVLLPWSLLFLLVSVVFIWWGKNHNDNIIWEMGIISIILNLYSRYVEYGWEALHPTVFFALLAVSFWLIGKKAEKIWTLGNFQKQE